MQSLSASPVTRVH